MSKTKWRSFAGPSLQLVAVAVLAAIVATALVTHRPSDAGTGALSGGDDRFPLAVPRPDLNHIDGRDVTVALGLTERELPADSSGSVQIDGTTRATGLLRVLDDDGNLAGMAVVPQDDVALLGSVGDDRLDVPVNYRTTAFGLFASQPGIAASEPAVTTIVAAMVLDLPEFDALAGALEEAAADDPAYLENVPDAVRGALDALFGAYQRRAADIERKVFGDERPPPSPPETTSTTQRLTHQVPADPDECEPLADEPRVIVIDPGRRDKVCLGEVALAGGQWEVKGLSKSPRWAIARAMNRGVPTAPDAGQLIPGRALALPSIERFAAEFAEAVALGLADELELCQFVADLLGRTCDEPGPGVLGRLMDQFKSYFADANFDIALNGAEAQSVLMVNGLGAAGGEAPDGDVATSVLATFLMTMLVPALDMVLNLRGASGSPTKEVLVALVDFAQQLLPQISPFLASLKTGDIEDNLSTLVDFFAGTVNTLVDSHLLLAVLQWKFPGTAGDIAREALEKLAKAVAAGPLKWVDLGAAAVNAGINLGMLLYDVFTVSSSARYALGYDAPPPLIPQPPSPPGPSNPTPDPNPPLPDDSCGIRVAIVLDRSSSISTAGGEDDVRGAAAGLIDALGGTPSSVLITSFAGDTRTEQTWTSMADADGRRRARQVATSMHIGDDYTNWEAALLDLIGQEPDLVVFVTDGNPNRYGVGMASTPGEVSGDFDPAALAAGVQAANLLKQTGSRVVAVGVGDVNASALAQVSGASEGDDYFVGGFDSLSTSLGEVASKLCGTSVAVRHLVDGRPRGGAAYTVEIEGEQAQQVITAPDGTTRVSLLQRIDQPATIRGPADQPLERISCDRGGQPTDADIDIGDRSATVDLDAVAVTCTFEWRALGSADELVAAIARGPGTVVALTFEPLASGPPPVSGCLGVGSVPSGGNDCAAAFGVSFTAGFAVLRYDDRCTGCEPAGVLAVTPEGDGVRFRLEATSSQLFTVSGARLDLRVSATPDPLGLGSGTVRLGGTVSAANGLRIEVPRLPPLIPSCLAHYRAGPTGVTSGSRPIELGVGC